MNFQKIISSIVLGAFAAASVFLLICPQMLAEGTTRGPCGEMRNMSANTSAAAQPTIAPTGCLQTHVAIFRSLIFVLPDVSRLVALAAVIIFALALAALWRRQLQLWESIASVKLKIYCSVERVKNNTKNFLVWLALLEQRDFASC